MYRRKKKRKSKIVFTQDHAIETKRTLQNNNKKLPASRGIINKEIQKKETGFKNILNKIWERIDRKDKWKTTWKKATKTQKIG